MLSVGRATSLRSVGTHLLWPATVDERVAAGKKCGASGDILVLLYIYSRVGCVHLNSAESVELNTQM